MDDVDPLYLYSDERLQHHPDSLYDVHGMGQEKKEEN